MHAGIVSICAGAGSRARNNAARDVSLRILTRTLGTRVQSPVPDRLSFILGGCRLAQRMLIIIAKRKLKKFELHPLAQSVSSSIRLRLI